MSDRTPSSLKWLVEKRRRIHSEIIYIEEKLGKLLNMQQNQLVKLQADLKAIDTTIRLHEITIEPENIPPITIYQERKGFKYGEITRLIYKCLAQASPDGLSTRQVVDWIILRKNLDIPDDLRYRELFQRIRYRLKNLYRDGKIGQMEMNSKPLWCSKI